MKCSKCGAEFNSKFCPECGAPADSVQSSQAKPLYGFGKSTAPFIKKRTPPSKAVIITLVSVFALLVLTVILIPTDDSVPTQNANASVSQSSSAASVEETIKVDYKALYKDYADNPINADKKYKDKLLTLTGTIANIDRDIGKNPYITFNVDEYGAQSIKMAFQNDEVVASLKKGESVTVTGTCDGTFASTIVVLNNCEITK